MNKKSTAKSKTTNLSKNIKKSASNRKTAVIKESSFIELNILSITAKDFFGNEKECDSDSSIETLKDDEIKLDIVVSPPT